MADNTVSAPKFERFLPGFGNSLVYLGMDVHKRSWSIALTKARRTNE
ncbi:hypothetical protein [Magnetococcus sp. PR-3]